MPSENYFVNAIKTQWAALKGPGPYLRRLFGRQRLAEELLANFSLNEQFAIVKALTELNTATAESSSIEQIRREPSQDLQFLIRTAIQEEYRKGFFGAGSIRNTAASFTSIRNTVLDGPLNEREGVRALASHWANKRRQLHGFDLFYRIVEQLRAYYGDVPVIERLANAPIPQEGFPDDLELRDFLCAYLCEDNLFQMRDATLKFVDTHAIWTLINEILLDQEYYFDADTDAPYIIDGGANFGMSSVYFKQLYPNAHIVAFEPVPYLHALFRQNIERNKLQSVEAVKKGLSAKPGTATFFVSKQYSMAGSLTDRRQGFDDQLEELSIETVPLSDYVTREVDFLKLDIEGSEGEVLLELGDKIRNIKQMSVEWHLSHNAPVRLDEVLSLLGRNGFEYQIGKSGNYAKKSKLKPMTHVGEMGTLNFWAARR